MVEQGYQLQLVAGVLAISRSSFYCAAAGRTFIGTLRSSPPAEPSPPMATAGAVGSSSGWKGC
jgi:hypothetical protein